MRRIVVFVLLCLAIIFGFDILMESQAHTSAPQTIEQLAPSLSPLDRLIGRGLALHSVNTRCGNEMAAAMATIGMAELMAWVAEGAGDDPLMTYRHVISYMEGQHYTLPNYAADRLAPNCPLAAEMVPEWIADVAKFMKTMKHIPA